jgi:opacity protein-like surface antigen
MKRSHLTLTVLSAMLCVSAIAGPPMTMAPPPPTACGIGWYFALDGGANVYQDFGNDQHVVINGADVSFGINDKIGGFGGIKIGYVFGASDWRFALEEDLYYNGVSAEAAVRVNGNEIATVDQQLNTGAFMTNLLLRYAPNGGCGLQPYILGGIGGWWGETGGDADVTVGNVTRSVSGGGSDNGGFAFQVGAGIDYYFSPKWSIFTEYKYLDYLNAGGDFTDSHVGQHLVGGGFRVHF